MYGDYFQVARRFLEANGYDALGSALKHQLNSPVDEISIYKIDIYIEKHGPFYHPARVVVITSEGPVSLVLNLAISSQGKARLKKEFVLIEELNREFPRDHLPQVYAQAEIERPGQDPIPLFLGQWLEGFMEFHLSRDPSARETGIAVWDTVNGTYFLSLEQARALYFQTAAILTDYYHLTTFKQIYPWHHAAGDFVVNVKGDHLYVKLITVRQYASMFEPAQSQEHRAPDVGAVLEALLYFVLNLSIRMRLDRMDGVGEIVWAPEWAVLPTLAGVMSTLGEKPSVFVSRDPIATEFMSLLASMKSSDLSQIMHAICDSYHPSAPELPVIRRHLDAHSVSLVHAVDSLTKATKIRGVSKQESPES